MYILCYWLVVIFCHDTLFWHFPCNMSAYDHWYPCAKRAVYLCQSWLEETQLSIEWWTSPHPILLPGHSVIAPHRFTGHMWQTQWTVVHSRYRSHIMCESDVLHRLNLVRSDKFNLSRWRWFPCWQMHRECVRMWTWILNDQQTESAGSLLDSLAGYHWRYSCCELN